MHFSKLSLLAAFAVAVTAQDIDDNDIPSQCRTVCSGVVQTTITCDATHDDDDSGFITCVCTSPDASSLIPNCEACVARYDEPDNDVRDFVSSCSFTTATTWTTPGVGGIATSVPASTTSISTNVITSGGGITTMTTDVMLTATAPAVSSSTANVGGGGVVTSTTVVGDGQSQTSVVVIESTGTGAAPAAATAGGLALGVGVLVAALV